jgi:hypothetical protein
MVSNMRGASSSKYLTRTVLCILTPKEVGVPTRPLSCLVDDYCNASGATTRSPAPWPTSASSASNVAELATLIGELASTTGREPSWLTRRVLCSRRLPRGLVAFHGAVEHDLVNELACHGLHGVPEDVGNMGERHEIQVGSCQSERILARRVTRLMCWGAS